MYQPRKGNLGSGQILKVSTGEVSRGEGKVLKISLIGISEENPFF